MNDQSTAQYFADEDLAGRVLAGSQSAAGELDRLFRQRLCALVEKEMNTRYRRREDAEDVVQSVFRTFFRRASVGEFRFDHRGATWKLLEQITRRKILKHVRFHNAQARDITKDESIAGQLENREPNEVQARVLGDALECVLKGLHPPEPEIYRLQLHGYTIAEIIDTVLNGLEMNYSKILQLRLQGQTETQIGQELGCSRAVVRYRLDRIRHRLRFLLTRDSEI